MPTIALERVTMGFTGGLTLSRRMTSEALEGLRTALDGDAAWHELRTEQETIVVSLARLAYVVLDQGGRRIGFL